MKPKYSGKKSRKFWDEINYIKNENDHSQAYLLGCILQDFEGEILERIKNLL